MSWQPIETAPKTGEIFLGWVSAVRYREDDDGSYQECDVSQIDFCQWDSMLIGGERVESFENLSGQIGDNQYITHWQPLPPPPNEN